MRRPVLGVLLATVLAAGAWAHPWQGFSALALAPDGRSFATGGRGGEVRLWETSTGEPVDQWQLSELPVVGLAFAPDGTLGAGLLDGTLHLLPVGSPPGTSSRAVDPPWRGLAWGHGQWMATGAHRLWSFGSTAEGPGVGVPGAPVPPPVSPLEFPRIEVGDLWAQGTFDGQITVGSLTDGRTLATWTAHEAAVTGLALSPDGLFLLSCSYDGSLAKWDPRTGRLLGRL